MVQTFSRPRADCITCHASSSHPARQVAVRYARGPVPKPNYKVVQQLLPAEDLLPEPVTRHRPGSPSQQASQPQPSLAERFVNKKYLAQDVGNVVHLGHVRFEVPDLEVARLFWEEGLGLTHDPGSLAGAHRGNLNALWYNIGRQQFHIAKGPLTQGLPPWAAVGIVMPNVNAIWQRIQAIQHWVGDIKLARLSPTSIEVTDPNGISVVVYESYPGFPAERGICYLLLPCHVGSAAGIAHFYENMLGATVLPRLDKKQAEVVVGPGTTLMFREVGALGPRSDENFGLLHSGWHASMYVANFSSVYQKLSAAGLIDNYHIYPDKSHHIHDALHHKQLRFTSVVGPVEGSQQQALLHCFMHEVRSMHHPQYMRALYNRGSSNMDIL